MGWWREARFGMFIHWGVYSVPAGIYKDKPVAGIGEWIMNRGKIPCAEYQAYAKDFNPVKFNALEWVRVAKQAGMKYIVITSKHHDGFAMFDSKVNTWGITRGTPFKRDPLRELAEACRAEGIKLGFYYSQAQDWNNGGSASGGEWDKAQERSMDEYIDQVAVPQVREILSNYGPDVPAVLWWDTPTDMNKDRAAKLERVMKELKPSIIHNNRLGGGYQGDTETPEQFVPARGYPGRDWETCMTLNNTWGFKKDDTAWKSAEKVIRNLCDIASKGGNYLLNVGPTAEGLIPEASVERLREVGAWMKANGEAIYGTKAGLFDRAPKWGRCTTKDGKVYLLVFNWPADGTLSVPLLGAVSKAWLLTNPSVAITATSTADSIELRVPAAAPDAVASVIVLQPAGDLKPAPIPPVAAGAGGVIQLAASEAELVGSKLRLGGENPVHIGSWTVLQDRPQWELELPDAGKYELLMDYACDPKEAGSEFQVTVGVRHVKGKVAATKSADDFQTVSLGTLEIKGGGRFTFEMEVTSKPGASVMNLRSFTLKPVKP
jgi:alpha-L-fucosidase